MFKRNPLYVLMLTLSVGLIMYTVYANFIHDPHAAAFLSHKTNLKRPLPLALWLNVMYVHVFFACLAMASGAINFNEGFLRRSRKGHRINGYIYLISVALVDLTSGYMAPYATGGKISSVAFNLLNSVWLGMTIAAIVQIRKKRVDKHRKWMVRSYAFCFTNLFIHLFTYVLNDGLGLDYVRSYRISIYAAIAALFLLAELVIRKVYKLGKN